MLRFPGLCREVSQATRRRLMSAAAARSASAARGPGPRSSRRGRRRRGATSRAEHREQPDAVLMTVGAHCDGVGLRHGAALFERCATGATSEFVQRHGPSSLCGYLGLDKARSVRIEPRSSVDRKTGQPGGGDVGTARFCHVQDARGLPLEAMNDLGLQPLASGLILSRASVLWRRRSSIGAGCVRGAAPFAWDANQQ